MADQHNAERELVVVRHPSGPSLLSSVEPQLNALLASRNAVIRPLFGPSEARIEQRRTTLAAAGVMVPQLTQYYRVHAPDEHLDELAAALRGLPSVEAAYVKPAPELAGLDLGRAPLPAEAPPATPDYIPRQGYLDAAPVGVDARFAWTVPGGTGSDVNIVDIEGAWNFTHEDLLLNSGGLVGGTPSNDLLWRNHGTAVIGSISGDANTIGISGICPNATISAISIFGMGTGRAIQTAADRLRAGDIILIELHQPGPRFNFTQQPNQRGYIAIEWWPDNLAAIRYAVALGVIVVEAAGNGAEDLDDPIYDAPANSFPPGWSNPFRRGANDSGAVLVGAGAPPPGTNGTNHGPDRSRLGFSNYGSAIDAQGWGREVVTSGYGDLQGGSSEDLWYTQRFSGTSSASPIVVGTLGCLQGVLRARGALLTPARARTLLRGSGSPQQAGPNGPASQRIGSRPDLRQLISTA